MTSLRVSKVPLVSRLLDSLGPGDLVANGVRKDLPFPQMYLNLILRRAGNFLLQTLCIEC